MKHELLLVKDVQRSVNPDTLNKQIRYIIDRALAGSRQRQGWKTSKQFEVVKTEGEIIRYTVLLVFSRDGKSCTEDLENRQFEQLKEMAETAGRSHSWLLSQVTDPTKLPELKAAVPISEKKYASFNLDNHAKFFEHLYCRENQIKIVQSALRAALLSNMEDRPHVCLQGPPGSSKTSIVAGVRSQLGENAVLNFDATSLTKAGAERILLEAENVPPVLCVEEIEKAEENSLRWLLGLMDSRGEVRKTNYRIGNVVKSTKMLVIATVNNVGLFRRMLEGALSSRFVHEVYCPRPEREVMQKILEREVLRMKDGKREWIKPAIDYCLDDEKVDDPRRVIAVMISGRDDLLDGSFQKSLKATRPPKE